MDQAFHLTIDSQGIARLIFDYPNEKINKLSIEALEEFEAVLDRLEKDSHVKMLVLSSAKEGIFIAGADVKSFDKLMREASFVKKTISMGHRVMNKLENLPFPSIAVIDGACLGEIVAQHR